MKRYLRIYKVFVSSSLSRELEFRANFIAKVGQNVMWIGFSVLVLLVLFRNTNSIAGWSRAESFALLGTVSILEAMSKAVFFSLTEIPEQVRRGTLDYVVTRPIDSQFWVSSRRFSFDQIGSFVAGLVMVIVGLTSTHHTPSALSWLAYGTSMLAAVCIFYSFNLAMMTTGIWLVRVDNLWVLSESVSSIARYPIDIYGANLKMVFIYFVPLALLATIPTTQLVRGLDLPLLRVSFLWATAALLLARTFWRFALRHYGSASS